MTEPFRPQTILVYVSSDPDDALGENVIKLPFLHALRASFPGARISWIAGTGTPLFAGPLRPLVDGHIDELLTDLDLPNRVSAALNLRQRLPQRQFDLIVDTQRYPLRSLQLRRIRHRRFISGVWKWALSDAGPPAGQPHTPHLVDKLMELVAAAAGRVVSPPWTVPLAPQWTRTAAALLPEGPAYVGFAPGAGNKARGKCWPVEHYIAAAQDQADKGRLPVFILGPAEMQWADSIRAAVPQALIPDLSAGPALTVALGGRLAAAVANCSGTGHMLAAGGCSMVSLFAPTDPRKYAPHTRRRICLRAQDFGGTTIEAIPVAAVRDAVDAQVAAWTTAPRPVTSA